MIYFDDFRFTAELRPRERFCTLANKKIVTAFLKLEIGEFDFETLELILGSKFENFEDEIRLPVFNELKQVGIKDPAIVLSLIDKSVGHRLKLVQELEETTKSVYKEIQFMPDINSIQVEDGHIKINEKWLNDLRQSCTYTPVNDKQRRFASLVKIFEETYFELAEILPSNISVIENEENQGLFILRNGKIDKTRNETLTKIK